MSTEQQADNIIILDRNAAGAKGTEGEASGKADTAPLFTPLTPQDMQQATAALGRLNELSQSKIINPRDDAERKGLTNFLQGFCFSHAGELFGCWVAIRQEYEPLITGFTALVRRSLNRIDAANAQANAQQKQQEQASTGDSATK
jgi:hypothetical protein